MAHSVPGADVAIVDVGGDDNSESTESNPAVKYDYIADALIQPRLYRLADAAQALQRRRQRVRPSKVQYLHHLTIHQYCYATLPLNMLH